MKWMLRSTMMEFVSAGLFRDTIFGFLSVKKTHDSLCKLEPFPQFRAFERIPHEKKRVMEKRRAEVRLGARAAPLFVLRPQFFPVNVQ